MTGARPLLVATDLDGSLLDEDTYSYEAARPALAALAHDKLPLILCSSKTHAEMAALARVLGDPYPYVVENGGAIVIPGGLFERVPGARNEGAFVVVPLGTPREKLVAALDEIARELDAELHGFASMGVQELEERTGLPRPVAEQALQREYDEPFFAEPRLFGPIALAAGRLGLRVTRGGRFFHLTGNTDKGRALRVLLDLYASQGRDYQSVGLGDSPNDLTLLQTVERPIVIPRWGGRVDAELARALPGAERAQRPGPAGWNDAVLTVLRGGRLPRLDQA